MADFESTQQEITNVINPEENSVVIIDPTTPSQKASVTASGELKVIVSGGGTAGQLVQDADIVQGSDVGRIFVGSDGSNYQFIAVDSTGQLQIDIVSSVLPTGAATESKQDTAITTLQAIQTAIEILDDWDESDRAKINPVVGQAGLAAGTGVDVANALRMSLATDIPLPVGDNILGQVKLVNDGGTQIADITDDSGTARLEVFAKIAAGGASQDVHPVDANGVDLDVVIDSAMPANTRALLIAGVDEGDIVRIPSILVDDEDDLRRLAIQGKISISAPTPPAAATPVSIAADTPLDVTGTETTDFEITTGETFTIQQITAGAEGDPTEKGAVIRVSYLDSGGTSHIIEQIYLTGQTVQIFPDTSEARDGTALVGFAGAGNGTIRIEREQFGGGTRELDVVLRGFEQ